MSDTPKDHIRTPHEVQYPEKQRETPQVIIRQFSVSNESKGFELDSNYMRDEEMEQMDFQSVGKGPQVILLSDQDKNSCEELQIISSEIAPSQLIVHQTTVDEKISYIPQYLKQKQPNNSIIEEQTNLNANEELQQSFPQALVQYIQQKDQQAMKREIAHSKNQPKQQHTHLAKSNSQQDDKKKEEKQLSAKINEEFIKFRKEQAANSEISDIRSEGLYEVKNNCITQYKNQAYQTFGSHNFSYQSQVFQKYVLNMRKTLRQQYEKCRLKDNSHFNQNSKSQLQDDQAPNVQIKQLNQDQFMISYKRKQPQKLQKLQQALCMQSQPQQGQLHPNIIILSSQDEQNQCVIMQSLSKNEKIQQFLMNSTKFRQYLRTIMVQMSNYIDMTDKVELVFRMDYRKLMAYYMNIVGPKHIIRYQDFICHKSQGCDDEIQILNQECKEVSPEQANFNFGYKNHKRYFEMSSNQESDSHNEQNISNYNSNSNNEDSQTQRQSKIIVEDNQTTSQKQIVQNTKITSQQENVIQNNKPSGQQITEQTYCTPIFGTKTNPNSSQSPYQVDLNTIVEEPSHSIDIDEVKQKSSPSTPKFIVNTYIHPKMGDLILQEQDQVQSNIHRKIHIILDSDSSEEQIQVPMIRRITQLQISKLSVIEQHKQLINENLEIQENHVTIQRVLINEKIQGQPIKHEVANEKYQTVNVTETIIINQQEVTQHIQSNQPSNNVALSNNQQIQVNSSITAQNIRLVLLETYPALDQMINAATDDQILSLYEQLTVKGPQNEAQAQKQGQGQAAKQIRQVIIQDNYQQSNKNAIQLQQPSPQISVPIHTTNQHNSEVSQLTINQTQQTSQTPFFQAQSQQLNQNLSLQQLQKIVDTLIQSNPEIQEQIKQLSKEDLLQLYQQGIRESRRINQQAENNKNTNHNSNINTLQLSDPWRKEKKSRHVIDLEEPNADNNSTQEQYGNLLDDYNNQAAHDHITNEQVHPVTTTKRLDFSYLSLADKIYPKQSSKSVKQYWSSQNKLTINVEKLCEYLKSQDYKEKLLFMINRKQKEEKKKDVAMLYIAALKKTTQKYGGFQELNGTQKNKQLRGVLLPWNKQASSIKNSQQLKQIVQYDHSLKIQVPKMTEQRRLRILQLRNKQMQTANHVPSNSVSRNENLITEQGKNFKPQRVSIRPSDSQPVRRVRKCFVFYQDCYQLSEIQKSHLEQQIIFDKQKKHVKRSFSIQKDEQKVHSMFKDVAQYYQNQMMELEN